MIFNQTTELMSQHEESIKGQIVCLLPELVSSLRKDIYFYAPEKTITFAEHQVCFQTFYNDRKTIPKFFDYAKFLRLKYKTFEIS